MGGFFFGRQLEQQRLGALDREPVALIYGLPGIGKSELAYVAIGALRAKTPWKEVQVTRVIVDAHVAPVLSDFLLARLTGHGGDLRELVELLVREPHLVVIDDAHLAGGMVAELIDELARRPQPASRLIATARTELPISTTPIVLKLGPLHRDEARALAEHLADRLGVKLDRIDELVDKATGSPFLLRHLVAGRRRGSSGSDPIHETIAVLDSETRRSLVQLAAVAGCSQSRLAAARLVPNDRVFDALTEQFLIDASPEQLVVHELVREAVLSDADPSVVATSRRSAAQVLWENYERSNAPILAVESICLSASAGDIPQAFARLREAIRSIASSGLDHLLVPALERLHEAGDTDATLALARVYLRMARIDDAAETLARLPSGFERNLSMLLTRATIAERRCQLAAAKRDFAAAIELAGAGRARTLVRCRLAIIETLSGDDEAARRLVAEIERDAPLVSDVDRIRSAWMHGIRHALHQDWTECFRVVAEGRRLAQQTNAHDLDFLLLLLELLVSSELGDVAHSTRLMAQVQLARPSAHLRGRMIDLYVGVAQQACGQLDQAVVTLERAFREHERHHDELLAQLAGHYLGRALGLNGELSRAIEVLSNVAQRARGAGCTPLVGPGEAHLARALLTVGRVGEVVAIAQGLTVSSLPWVAAEGHALLAYTRAFDGDIEAARDGIALALDRIGDREPARTDIVLDQAHIEIMGGDPERARQAAWSVLEDEVRSRRPYARGRALFVTAVADLAAGLTDVAISELAELDALATAHGLQFFRARTALLRSATSHRGSSILERVPAEQQRGYLGILRILGLRSETVVITTSRGRIHVDPGALHHVARHHDVLVDTGSGAIYGRSGVAVEGRGVAASILVALADGVEPVSAERLYQIVWGGNDYHPLRHRNTLYIALNRTRKLLDRVVGDREVIRREGTGWVIAPDVDIAVARRDPRVSTVSGQRPPGS